MESPLAQSLLSSSSISSENSQSNHHEKTSQTTTSSSHMTPMNQHTSPIKPSQANETHSTGDEVSVQGNGTDQDDRVQQINALLSKLLDNVQEEAQEPLLSLDTPSKGHNTSFRDYRSQYVQKIDIEEGQDEDECPSKSAPSPSVGRTNESSPSSPSSSVSSSEDEIVDTESPCKAEEPIVSIKDMLDFSTVKIDFGANFPGMTLEECLEITNKTNQDITVQLSVSCLNTECQQLMGYVYGLRRSLYYDINSRHEIVIKPQSSVSFTVVLKAPRMKIQGDVLGEILASVKGVEDAERISISSSVYIPQIICPKELYNHENKCSVINLAINKKSKKLDTKFSLKNLSEVPVTLQLSFYQPPNVEEDPALECGLFPSTVTIPAKGLAIVNIGLKKPKAIAKRTEQDPKSFKKVLVGTMRGCALIYSFLLHVELHE